MQTWTLIMDSDHFVSGVQAFDMLCTMSSQFHKISITKSEVTLTMNNEQKQDNHQACQVHLDQIRQIHGQNIPHSFNWHHSFIKWFIFISVFPLGRVPGGIPGRIRNTWRSTAVTVLLASYYDGTKQGQRCWDLSIRQRSGSTIRTSLISQRHALSGSITQWNIRKNLISAASTWDSIPSVVAQYPWP